MWVAGFLEEAKEGILDKTRVFNGFGNCDLNKKSTTARWFLLRRLLRWI